MPYKNRETQLQYLRNYSRNRRKDPKVRQRDSEHLNEYKRKNPIRHYQMMRMGERKRQGINLYTILRKEPLSCEVCGAIGGTTKTKRGLACDHDHQTGKFRGWLCNDCNILLGYLERKSKVIDKLLAYQKIETTNNVGELLTTEQFRELHYVPIIT